MIWAYKAATPEGKIIHGFMDSKSMNEAVAYLRSKSLIPISIGEHKQKSMEEYISFLRKYTTSDLILFTRQLASMLTSGLTLMQALVILREQMQKQAMKDLIQGIISQIEEGKTFAAALQVYPAMFSSIYIALIHAGETSGILDKLLIRLADNLEKEQNLKGKVKSALLYPIIVVIMMIGVMIVMMIAVIPQLGKLYEGLNVGLPWSTQVLITMSNFIINFWPLVIIGVFIVTFLYRKWSKTEEGEIIVAEVALKIPIFGKLIREAILAEISRTLGLLIGTGTLVVEALKETAGVSGNVIYKNAMLEIAKRVEKGISIGEAMTVYTLFPPILVQTVKIGEETGKLDESLVKVSEYFEREAEMMTKTLTTAMEPLIMIVLGIGVTFLVISIITPIYNITSSFH